MLSFGHRAVDQIQPFGGVFQVGAQRAQPGTEHVAVPVIRPVLPATHRDRAGGHQRLFGQLAMIEKPAAQHPADHRDQTCGGPSELISQTQAWTGVHELWLRKQRFDAPGLQLAYDAAFDAMLATLDRRDRLDQAITAMAADSPFTPVVCRLGCVRGISTLTAFGLAVEIGDWDRLSGRSIGAYLGLVPTENSSGATRTQGGVTKTGNTHARRLLIEAAWHHRRPYRPGRDLRRRWEAASPAARARGQAANRRLHARWISFDERKKRPVVANAAIARELAGWCWSLAVLDG